MNRFYNMNKDLIENLFVFVFFVLMVWGIVAAYKDFAHTNCNEFTTSEYLNNDTPIRCAETAKQVRNDYYSPSN